MTPIEWTLKASAISPLVAFAEGAWGGETGIIEKIFSVVPTCAGFGVEFGQPTFGSGTLSSFVERHRWGALYMDGNAVSDLEVRPRPDGRPVTLARERVMPGNINSLFEKHGVPAQLDCLVIDIDGLDYWVWDAIETRYSPSLVIVEFNAHVGFGVEATIKSDEAWVYRPSTNYGASFSALCALAARKGYRLIHVHGPWNLYFLRKDLPFPSELSVKWPLDEADLAQLIDTENFYEALCGPGKRPTWFGAERPDVSRDPWEVLAPPQPSRTVDLEGLRIEVLADKYDPTWYLQRKTFEEKVSLLYRLIRDEGFENIVDIGANVGFISVVAKRAAPALKAIAFEADPRLVHLMRRNFRSHGLDATVVNAIVGSHEAANATFSLNPTSSLDNRVSMDAWQKIGLPMVTVDGTLRRLGISGKTFFKIDTQGFELNVLKGMEATLSGANDWVLKMEFGPHWLRSQGTDPLELLDYLQARYEFAEHPERLTFGTPSLDALFAVPIQTHQHAAFLEHVVPLNKDSLGWVDLIVRPKRA